MTFLFIPLRPWIKQDFTDIPGLLQERLLRLTLPVSCGQGHRTPLPDSAGKKKSTEIPGQPDSVLWYGTPDAIRTRGLRSRSPILYPAELRAHVSDVFYQIRSIIAIIRNRKSNAGRADVTIQRSAIEAKILTGTETCVAPLTILTGHQICPGVRLNL